MIAYHYIYTMFQTAIQNYYTFFDETLQSSTFIVLIISAVIFLVGSITPVVNAQNSYVKSSILEISSLTEVQKNIVIIDGIAYELNFSRVK